jgi:hypothetical protein
MFICRDVTQVRQLAEEVQKKEEENRSMLDRVAQIAALEPQLLTSFLEESNALIEISASPRSRALERFDPSCALRAPQAQGQFACIRTACARVQGPCDRGGAPGDARGRSPPDAWKQIRTDMDGVADLVREADRFGQEVIAQRSVVGSPHDRQRIKPIVDAARYLTANFEKAFAEVSVEQRTLLAELPCSIALRIS